ncbi:MAG: permease [Firmicutes bacterium]|nr:permease [Bacillota bacterium]
MYQTELILAAAAIILGFTAWRKDRRLLWDGLKLSSRTFWNLMPLLIAAFMMAGLLEVVVPEQFVENWLSTRAAWKGILVGGVAGAAVPGGPYVAFPIFGSFWRAGAGIGTIVAFVTSWSVWGISNIAFELAIVGPRFSLIRIVLSAVFPFISGFLALALFG